MLGKLKAIAAAVVGAAAFYIGNKLGFEISMEVQAAIVGAIMYAVTWAVPNIEEPAA